MGNGLSPRLTSLAPCPSRGRAVPALVELAGEEPAPRPLHVGLKHTAQSQFHQVQTGLALQLTVEDSLNRDGEFVREGGGSAHLISSYIWQTILTFLACQENQISNQYKEPHEFNTGSPCAFSNALLRGAILAAGHDNNFLNTRCILALRHADNIPCETRKPSFIPSMLSAAVLCFLTQVKEARPWRVDFSEITVCFCLIRLFTGYDLSCLGCHGHNWKSLRMVYQTKTKSTNWHVTLDISLL